MGKSQRNYGIELLRIVAMSMIVMLHTLARSGLLHESTGIKHEISWIIELFCYASVDCFLLISGYVNLKNQFKISRVVKIWAQVVFYLLLFEAINQIVKHTFSGFALLQCFFPFTTNAYWFYSYYFLLMFFMPFVNAAVQNLSAKQCKGLIVTSIIILSVIPFIYQSPLGIWEETDMTYTQRGYSLIWFITMYAVGTALRRINEDGESRLDNKRINVVQPIIYICCAGVTYLIVHYCRVNGLKEYFAASYTSPLIVICAVSLLFFFKNLKLSKVMQKIIAFLAPGAFGVYLIHSNPDVFSVHKQLVRPLLDMRVRYMIPSVFFAVAAVVLITLLADILRGQLFRITKLNSLFAKADKLPINNYFNREEKQI